MISAIGSSEAKTYPLQYMAQVIDEIANNKSVQLLFNYIPNQKKIENLNYHYIYIHYFRK